MARASDVFSALFDAVSSQVSHGKADEITVDPSSQHVSQNAHFLDFLSNADELHSRTV